MCAAFVQISMLFTAISMPAQPFHQNLIQPFICLHCFLAEQFKSSNKDNKAMIRVELQQTFMTLLVSLVIILSLEMADCQNYQDGHWTSQVYSNNSFLYTFLEVEEGQARLSVMEEQDLLWNPDLTQLQITLFGICKDKTINRQIKISFQMNEEENKKAQFSYIQKRLYISFLSFNVTKQHYQNNDQEHKLYQNVSFNVSYTYRKWLEFRSNEGVFRIKLIDIEQVSPRVYVYLWAILILILMLVVGHIAVSIRAETIHHIQTFKYHPTLGFWTNYLIISWIIKSVYGIYQQTYYLPNTLGSSLLAKGTWVIMIILGFELFLSFKIYDYLNYMPTIHGLFALVITHASLVFLWAKYFPIIPSHLQYYLAVVIAYEIITIPWALQDNKIMKNIHIAIHMFLYMFPCIIFPVFSFETRYPQQQVQIWWLYGLFYIVEVALFLMIPVRATCFKLKRLVKLTIQRHFNSQNYLTLQEKACPLCLKQVQTSQIGMNQAGEAPKVDWIQAGCNHHFHKACVRQNMKDIDCCLFDKAKWSEKFKKSAQK